MIEKNLGLNKLSFSLMYFYVLIGAKKYLVTAVFFFVKLCYYLDEVWVDEWHQLFV
jgi:hypothetical protein